MPKYLLLKHYSGGPEQYKPCPPMDQWAPEDVDAHMAFLHEVSRILQEKGEFVDAQALTPVQTWVRYGGPTPRLSSPTPRIPRPAISSPAGTWSTSTATSVRSSWRPGCRRSRVRVASRSTSGSTSAR
jgi:hypothetical protein